MRENSRKLRFETSMLLISRGHVLTEVSHVGRITLRDMSALRVMQEILRFPRNDDFRERFSEIRFGTVLLSDPKLLF